MLRPHMIDNGLWHGLLAFYGLLIEKQSNCEMDYQNLFESHSVLFIGLEVKDPRSFEKRSPNKLPYDEDLRLTPEPDFICLADMSNALIAVELKTPFVGKIYTARSDGNRAKLTSLAETYLSQCAEYCRSILGNKGTRDYLCSLFCIDRISEVRTKLIYALSDDNDLPLIESLCSQRNPRVEIITYDFLFNKLCSLYSTGASIPHGKPGLTCVYHLTIDTHQVNATSVLTKITGDNGDQLMVTYCSGTLSFSLLNKDGETRILSGTIEPDINSYVKLEYAYSDAGSYFSLSINDSVTDKHISSISMPFALTNPVIVFGADRSGENGICCRLHEHYITRGIMNISDSLGSYHYHQRKKGNLAAVVFCGSHFLYTGNNNSLKQDDPKHQPRYHNPAQQGAEPDAASLRQLP
jgi:hypothetical protein